MERKSKELARAMAEAEGILKGINVTMATIEFAPDGTVITANDNFLKAMKYSLDEIKGKHHRKFVPKEILESEEYKTFWNRLASGKSFTGIFKRISASGDSVWLNAIYNPILDSNGEVIKVVKFATDITAEHEMLAESKGVLSGINATMATIEFKPDGTILTANENFLKVMKYSLSDIKGQHHRKFVPKEILESEEYKTFWKRLASGESLTGIFKRISAAGDTVWLNAIYNPILNATGEVIKVVKFATDITAQQEMLAEIKGVLNGINSTMATIEFKPDGTILSANEKFLRTMKYSLHEIKGQHHRKFVPAEILDSEEYKTFWKRLASRESLTGIFKRISATGDTVWLNAIYNPILNANGEVTKVVKFATDITAEQERINNARN
jgi:methyl-accepting chemotaxis protein